MDISEIIRMAIQEDVGYGDHTSLATIPPEAKGHAVILARQEGVLAGLPFAVEVFRQVNPGLETRTLINDGATITPGTVICELLGPTRAIVSGERLALNLLQRLSGIATYTRMLTEKIKAYPAKLLDTRKTTPLLRSMEKYAVRTGGGTNHRMGLYDMVMIKDNHVDYAGGIQPAIQRVNEYLKSHQLNLPIEIEVRSLQELNDVLTYGQVNRIMLDNFTPELLKQAVQTIDHRYETEASGGITEGNIVQYAATGVDYISVGALTHQIRSLDISLKAR